VKIRPVAAELFHVDGRTDRHDELKQSPLAISLTRLKVTEILTGLPPSQLKTDRSAKQDCRISPK